MAGINELILQPIASLNDTLDFTFLFFIVRRAFYLFYWRYARYAYLLNDRRVCKAKKLSILYYWTHFDGSFEIQYQTIRTSSLRVHWCKCLSLLQLAIMINIFQSQFWRLIFWFILFWCLHDVVTHSHWRRGVWLLSIQVYNEKWRLEDVRSSSVSILSLRCIILTFALYRKGVQ